MIPVRNDAARLERCLRSIRANDGVGSPVEIVVADNGSTDTSAAVARQSGAKVLSLPNLRLGALRNTGASETSGNVVAFVDADHELDSGWVSAATALLADSHVDGVGAEYSPPSPATWVQRSYDRLRRHPRETEVVDWLGSGNLAIRRESFLAVGGFDATLETCEDVDLCRRIRLRGGVLLADPRLRTIHHGDPRTLRQVFFGELWRGRDNIRVSLRPPRTWRMLLSMASPLVNLAALAALVLGLTGLLPHSGLILIIGVALVLAQLALRTLVMLRRGSSLPLSAVPGVLAVAAAYELGRSLSLLGRFGYRHRRSTAAPV